MAGITTSEMQAICRVSALLIVLFNLPLLSAQDHQAEITAHLQKAKDAIAHHELKLASDEYQQVLRLDPKNAEISAARGIALYALGQPAEAIASLKNALALGATQTNAEVFLGLSLADLAQCKDAIPLLNKHFNEALEPKLRRVAGLSLLSCEASLSRTDDAVDVTRQLTRWYPGDEDVLYQTAELYSQLSRKSVNDLLHDHPDSYRIHQLAGEALESQNNDNQALIEYRKALEINPKAPHTHYRMGEILLRDKQAAGGEAEALAQFQQEIAVNPGDAPSEYAIAEILRGRNQLPSARSHFERALLLNPSFVEAHIGLAKLYAAERNSEQALAHAQRAVELSPQDPAAHYALMVIYRDLGKAEDAKRELALVEDLNAKKESDFRANLQMLLTGQRSSH